MTLIAVVDDHLLLVETVSQALRLKGFEVVACSAGGSMDELRDRLLRLAPDLALLDLDLGPAGDSTPLVAPLAATGCRVLLVTGLVDRLRIAAAVEQGAIGYQPKAKGFEALVDAAVAALTCSGPLNPAEHAALRGELAAARLERHRRDEPFARLTGRERETLRALGEGHSVRQIADDWVVSETTVRSHVRSVLSKLGASSQLQAVADAVRHGWLARR